MNNLAKALDQGFIWVLAVSGTSHIATYLDGDLQELKKKLKVRGFNEGDIKLYLGSWNSVKKGTIYSINKKEIVE